MNEGKDKLENTEQKNGAITAGSVLKRLVRPGFEPLTKANQRSDKKIINKHGRIAFLHTPNWADRGCWVYFKHYKGSCCSGLIEYADYPDWMIEV